MREFALAVPPIGGLAAAQILLRPYGRHRLRLYCASLDSEVVVTVGGGYPEVAGDHSIALGEGGLSKVTTLLHFWKVPSKSVIVSTTLRGHFRQV